MHRAWNFDARSRERGHVRFESKADMCNAKGHVRFVPIADIARLFDHLVGAQQDGLG